MDHELYAIEVCARTWVIDVSRGLVTARTRSSWTESWDLNQVKESYNHMVYDMIKAIVKVAYLSSE